jgi:ribosomal-protein-alanine N-acetyltransferase
MTYLIRPPQPPEAAAIAALVRDAFSATETPLNPAPSAGRLTAAAVLETLARPGGGGAVAVDGAPNGAIIGSVLWDQLADGRFHVMRLAVPPASRRRGIARRLMQIAEITARTRGLARIWLSTRLALPGNRTLYERLGYQCCGVKAHPGFAAPTIIEFEKYLTDKSL